MMASYSGTISARIIELKFALAGKVASVRKFTGDTVTKSDLVASLDRTSLQAELDKQLADFEKVRADFEIFNQKNPSPVEAIDKYLKTEKQAMLNASVKDVELAKARLDQADLISPVAGVVIDDSGLIPGIYITPSGSPLKIADSSAFYFEFKIDQKDIGLFASPREVKIEAEGVGREIAGTTKNVFSDGKNFMVRVPIADSSGLLIGMSGKVNF